MTKPDLENISRDELIEQALAAHHRAEAERARRVETERQLDWFKKQLFGAKSERRLPVEADPSQLSLGETTEVRDEGEAEATPVAGHRRRAPKKQKTDEDKGLRFDESVPVDTIRLEPDELRGAHADEYEVISEKETFRLAQQPASYRILRYVRPVLKRRATGEIVSPLAPASVLPGSYADVSLLAGMLVDKFRSHLPLYRQHQRLHAAGITVSRTSLTNWVHQAIELLEPIYDAQLASILTSSVLAMDETPVRAGRKGKGKMRTGYFWPVYGDQQEVAFPFAPSRAKKYVEEILGEYAGTLLTDGYTAYERYAEQRDAVVHAQCWVHARRGFVKAEDVEPVRSASALEWIGKLYAIESEIAAQGLEGEAKVRARGERSQPIVAELFAWLERELASAALLPTNAFTKAAFYVLDRRAALEVFLSDADVAPDTNHLERALRVIPMGRKNWLFAWTEVGAEQVGYVQSLLTTCTLHGIDPYTYLVDVLQRVETHPFSRVEELTPRLWKTRFADDPLRSDIYPASI